jgi:hypothetical protein
MTKTKKNMTMTMSIRFGAAPEANFLTRRVIAVKLLLGNPSGRGYEGSCKSNFAV